MSQSATFNSANFPLILNLTYAPKKSPPQSKNNY